MITVAGLTNVEINLKVKDFPVDYKPIDYPSFGVDVSTAGVGYNIAKALGTLGSDVCLLTLGATDATSRIINADLESLNLKEYHKIDNLKETPQSVNLYDESGRRSIYCDLKNIQESRFDAGIAAEAVKKSDAAILCNINFARPMLRLAREAGVPVITDVHVLSNPKDEYDMDFFKAANVLFLSDEGIGDGKKEFVQTLADLYKNIDIIVLGMGADGAMMFQRKTGGISAYEAVKPQKIVNTVGAGDALLSAFTHFYIKGMEAVEALHLAQKFASIKIGTSGAANGFVPESMLKI